MDAALGLDAVVAPTPSCEEGSCVVLKNKGLCIAEQKQIQYCFSWTGICLMCTTIQRHRAGSAWLAALGSKQKSFNLSKRNLNFIFSCWWPAHPSSSLWTHASWQLLGLKNLGGKSRTAMTSLCLYAIWMQDWKNMRGKNIEPKSAYTWKLK